MSAPQTENQDDLLRDDGEHSDGRTVHSSDSKLADVRLCFGPFFIVFIAGKERRSLDRLKSERQVRPVFTVRNIPLLLIIWGSLIFSFYSLISVGLQKLISIV